MKIFLYLILLLTVFISCKHADNELNLIEWAEEVRLPSLSDGKPNPGLAGAYAGISNNYLIIYGGANFPDRLPWEGGTKAYHNDIYVFKRSGRAWRYDSSFRLGDSFAYGASLTMPDGVLCLGGENSFGITDKSFLLRYDELQGSIIEKSFKTLPIPLTNMPAVCIGSKIYIAGGATTSTVSDKVYAIDYSDTNADWVELTTLPGALTNFVMAADAGQIYVIGGRCLEADGISNLFRDVYAYDIDKNEWTKKESLPYPLSAGTGISVNSQQILVFGGDKGETFHKTELLMSEINQGRDAQIRDSMIAEKNNLQATHPGFSRRILSYSIREDSWTDIGEIPFTVPVTTSLVSYNDEIIIASGEIKAGVRTPYILVGHLKTQ